MSASPALKPERLWTKLLLWPLAFLMAASAMLYQRATGPTYPSRGTYEVSGEEYKFALLRSQETSEKARIILPAPNPESITATIWWRRYPTDDAFGKEPMIWHPEQEWRSSTLFDLMNPPEGVVRNGLGAYTTDLPIQPAAGKVEYYITVDVLGDDQSELHLPAEGETCVLRYKDPVPNSVLFPHISFMILTILVGMRTGLAALLGTASMRRLAWTTLTCCTIGAMILGPFVQKYAFGHYWTGFPNGSDLTDNKSLIMWVSWIVACAVIGLKAKPKETVSRVAVLLATVVMIGVYLIPHSMQGSELDYAAIEEGVDPRAAVGTGED